MLFQGFSAKTKTYPANIYLFKVKIETIEKKCEICSKLKLKAQEWRRSGVFIVNFEYISHFFLVFLLMTLNRQMLGEYLQYFFQVNETWHTTDVFLIFRTECFCCVLRKNNFPGHYFLLLHPSKKDLSPASLW